jgi:hypothetical protein
VARSKVLFFALSLFGIVLCACTGFQSLSLSPLLHVQAIANCTYRIGILTASTNSTISEQFIITNNDLPITKLYVSYTGTSALRLGSSFRDWTYSDSGTKDEISPVSPSPQFLSGETSTVNSTVKFGIPGSVTPLIEYDTISGHSVCIVDGTATIAVTSAGYGLLPSTLNPRDIELVSLAIVAFLGYFVVKQFVYKSGV